MTDEDKDEAREMMAEQPALAAPPRSGEAGFADALAELQPAAWRRLFEENYDRVYRYAYLRTGNSADADDIAAMTFEAAARGIGAFRYHGKPVASWLFGIAHNHAVDLLKRRSRAPLPAAQAPEDVAARDDIAALHERQDIAGAIGLLKPAHRDVVALRLVEGHSVAEVARLLGKSEGAIKVTQMRALRVLRRHLGIEQEGKGRGASPA